MKPVILTFVILTNVFRIELAQTFSEKERGMMFRKSWGDIDGMLFVNQEPEQSAYWMKNTYLPLKMIFLDSNWIIRQAVDAQPLSTEIISSSNDCIQYVLEIDPDKTNVILGNYSRFREKLKSEYYHKTKKKEIIHADND